MTSPRDRALVRAGDTECWKRLGRDLTDAECDVIIATVDAKHPPTPSPTGDEAVRAWGERVAREARARGGRVTFISSHELRVCCHKCDGEGSVALEGDDSELCEDCMGSGCLWPDDLFAEIDATSPNDDASLARILTAAGPPPPSGVTREQVREIAERVQNAMRDEMMRKGEVDYDDNGFPFWQGEHVETDLDAIIASVLGERT